jgi:hypothetical protein
MGSYIYIYMQFVSDVICNSRQPPTTRSFQCRLGTPSVGALDKNEHRPSEEVREGSHPLCFQY